MRIFVPASTDMNMLHSFRNVVIAFLLPLSVSAQDSRNGPKVGLGISCQTFGQFLAWNGQPKLGPLLGWSFEAPVTSQVSLLIEPMYIMKGSRTVDSYYKTRTTITLNYLEMPLLLKISTNPDPQGLFITGGFMYGYFLGGKSMNYQYGDLVSTYSYAGDTQTNRSQWSAALGIGHEKGSWMWELRGQNSLNTFQPLQRSHNVVYSVQLTWRFPTQEEKEQKRKAIEADQD